MTRFQHALPGEAFDFSEAKLPEAAAVPVEEFTESLLFRGRSTIYLALDVDASSCWRIALKFRTQWPIYGCS